MATLLAFESAARHGNFSRAAKEMAVTQPAVSRQIATLEKQLAIRLFERSPEGVKLTDAGARFREAVKSGLNVIQAAATEASSVPHGEQVVIACPGDASHLFLLPRHDALQAALGEHTAIRVLTFSQHVRHFPVYPAADLVLTWEASIDTKDYVVIHEEIAGPVCSPQFARQHREVLRQPVSAWTALTCLDLAPPELGWVSWDDWFAAVGYAGPAPEFRRLDSYTYVLDAAIRGRGIAMGWRRYLDRHLETGDLVPLADGFATLGNRFCGALTKQGRFKPTAQRCLALLAQDP